MEYKALVRSVYRTIVDMPGTLLALGILAYAAYKMKRDEKESIHYKGLESRLQKANI